MKCVNLCDLLDKVDFHNNNVEKLLQSPNLVDAKRLYIGSYFCSQYFLRMDFIAEIKQFLNEHSYSLTLVIPIFSEKDSAFSKEKIKQICDELPIDEVTVNDIGMLIAIHSSYDLKVNLGRLFFKDARDIRLPSYYQHTIHPAFLDTLNKYNTCFTLDYAEIDPISATLDVHHNTDVKLALHEPFCYLTTGNICKFASISQDIAKKFRPNASCNKECQRVYEIYFPNSNDYTLYRIGRAVYFETERPCTINGSIERFIYSPFREMADCRKEGASN